MKIIPLGGLKTIGRNMAIVEIETGAGPKILVLDCGIMFPNETEPGISKILPDFSYLEGRYDQIEAVVLTHGHEDHIGGVPYLLQNNPTIPVIGSKFTLALTEKRTDEKNLKPKFIEVQANQKFNLPNFELEFIAVNHSIPDALAILVRTKEGTVLDTGDIKLDQTPIDGRITDLNKLAEVSKAGVDLLMIDSTNAIYKGVTPTELGIEKHLDFIFSQSKKKIIVTSFASHIHRIQQILNVAARHHKKVLLDGRTMKSVIPLAKELGYMDYPNDLLVRKLNDVPTDKLVVVSTGSQGEPLAALSRIAKGDSEIEVKEGDTIIFASSLIPGNEKAVFSVINQLSEKGAIVWDQKNAKIHVSGHAAETDLEFLYNVIKPRNVLPIHGEPMHLLAQRQIAEKVGIRKQNILNAEDGDVIELKNQEAKVVDKIPNKFIYVEKESIGTTTSEDLSHRNRLAKEGAITIFAIVNVESKTILKAPEIYTNGLPDDGEMFKPIQETITTKLARALEEGISDEEELSKIPRDTIRDFLKKKHRRYPVINSIVATV